MAMASTKMVLKTRLEAVFHFLDAPDQGFDDAARRGIHSAMRAPGSRAFPARAHLPRSQSGIIPRMVAYLTSIWLPKAPGEGNAIDVIYP